MSPHPPCSGPTGSTGPPDRGLEGQADGKTIFPGMWVSMGGPHRHTCPCTLQAHTSHNAPRDQTLPGRFLPKGLGKAEGKGIGRTRAGSLDCSPNFQVPLPSLPHPETGATPHPGKRLCPHLGQGAIRRPPSYPSSRKPSVRRVTPNLTSRLKALAEPRYGTQVSYPNPGLCPQSTLAFQRAERTIQDTCVSQDLGQGKPWCAPQGGRSWV